MARFLAALKNGFSSWTLYLNAAMTVLAALSTLLPASQFPTAAMWIAGLTIAGNTLLRIFKTDSPIIPPATPTFPPAIQSIIDIIETKFDWIRDAIKGRGKEIPEATADTIIESAAASLKEIRLPAVGLQPPVTIA